MKEYEHKLLIDEEYNIHMHFKFSVPETPEEGFKEDLRKGHAATCTVEIDEVPSYPDYLTRTVWINFLRAIILMGIADKTIMKGDRFYREELYIQTNTSVRTLFRIDDSNLDAIRDEIHRAGHPIRINYGEALEEIYDTEKYQLPEGVTLTKIKHEDRTYDSRDKYRKMDDMVLLELFSDKRNVMRKAKMFQPDYKKVPPKERKAIIRQLEKLYGDDVWYGILSKVQEEFKRVKSVIDERRQVVFDKVFDSWKNAVIGYDPECSDTHSWFFGHRYPDKEVFEELFDQ